MRRLLTTALAALALVVMLSACSPAQIRMFRAITARHEGVLSGGQLAALRQCESGGNYRAHGRYHGAYQFSQSTWNSTAARHYSWLQGRDPHTVEPWWQDAMARALWADTGGSAWPHCRRVV